MASESIGHDIALASRALKRYRFAECLRLLQGIAAQDPLPESPELAILLRDILARRTVSLSFLRQAAWGCVARLKDRNLAVPCLIEALFLPETEIATEAENRLAPLAHAFLPLLLLRLDNHPKYSQKHTHWNLQGVRRLARLLGDSRAPKATKYLLDLLYRNLPHTPSNGRNSALLVSAALAIALLILPVIMGVALDEMRFLGLFFAIGILLFFGISYLATAFLGAILQSVTNRAQWQNIQIDVLKSLRAIENKRALPRLFYFYSTNNFYSLANGELRLETLETLQALLLLVDEKDRALFDTYSASYLIQRIDAQPKGFVLAVLHALRLHGDAQALPAMRRLIKKSQDPETAIKAQETLEAIERRIDQGIAADTLLRGAGAPKEASHELLRPALEETDPPELLLRPQSKSE